jgi:AhpC/TSA family
LSDPSGKEATQARCQSEELFERAAEKYGDVIGNKAKRQFFTLRFLSVGKVAPDIKGEDQDGKPLKLSDYRGKVVLLDFWSQG